MGTESQLSSFGLASISAISGCAGFTGRLIWSYRVPLVNGTPLGLLRSFLATKQRVPANFRFPLNPIFYPFRVARAILPLFWLPVLAYTLCHTKPIFDSDYHNKRSNAQNNMSSRKRSNTYWSTDMFAPSVAICIARTICLCSSEAMCIDQSILHRRRATTCTGQPIYHPESAAICIDCTNMPPSWYDLQCILKFISYCPRCADRVKFIKYRSVK